MASLVTVARYRTITVDTTSGDAAVTAALEAAQAEVEEYLRRPLTSESRTETVRFAPNGRLYPAATPITVGPSGTTIIDESAIAAASPDAGPEWPGLLDASYPSVSTITYTGGYDADTLPRTIEKHIAWLAWQLLHVTTNDTAGLPAGACSASVGDVSINFGEDAGPGTELSDAARRELRPWRRKFV